MANMPQPPIQPYLWAAILIFAALTESGKDLVINHCMGVIVTRQLTNVVSRLAEAVVVAQ